MVLHLVGADQDPILGIEATCFPVCATAAVDIMAVQVAPELLDVIAEEPDYGTCVDSFLAWYIPEVGSKVLPYCTEGDSRAGPRIACNQQLRSECLAQRGTAPFPQRTSSQ